MYKEGYVMLVSVLVLTIVGSLIALSTVTLGILSTQNNDAVIYGTQARSVANGCAEIVLQQIRGNDAFTGTGTESIGTGSCDYNVSNLGGENRQIDIDGSVNGYYSRLEILTNQLTPTINIDSWQEVN